MSSKRPASCIVESGEDSDYEPHRKQHKRKTRQPRKAKEVPPVYEAVVDVLAENAAAGSGSSVAAVDKQVVAWIKKCLDRASHPNTPEAEAKAALHLASKLMGYHNVTQAEILSHVPASERRGYAGQSTVTIQRADGGTKTVRLNAYHTDVCSAMETFFNCKHYTTTSGVGWPGKGFVICTFYGLADNTVAAAMAFETAINLIEKWCVRYKGGDRKSYVMGVANELRVMAKEEADAEAGGHRKPRRRLKKREAGRRRLIVGAGLTGSLLYHWMRL